jgi:type III pantothenate kinase
MQEMQKDYFVVDAGNTNMKLCQVIDHEIRSVELFSDVSELCKTVQNKYVVCSSVLNSSLSEELKRVALSFFKVNHKVNLPFNSNYQTMDTLGTDRMCNVAGMLKYGKNKNCLSVDIGTCIKFDFITADAIYKGGSIAPGIRLRYQSLNEYTNNLPLINEMTGVSLVGDNTQNSMISGVLNGIRAEITGMISRYEQEYGSIDIYMTGGDAIYFDIPQKNNIFAVENLTLEGAVEIYKLNAL